MSVLKQKNKVPPKFVESPKFVENKITKDNCIQVFYGKEALDLKSLEIEKFSYIISHDLQEPLRQIISFSNILKKSLQDQMDEKTNRHIKFITDATERMKKKLEGLRAFAEASEIKPVLLKGSDVKKILDQALFQLHCFIQEKKAKIEISSSLPQVFADKVKLKLVFFHLIENAIKFNSSNQPPVIHISGEKYDGEFSIFRIKDNGIGILQKYFNKIFSLYQRLHPVGTFEGVGTGLSIVKEIVQKHKGEVTLTSEEGKGSEFSFTLPRFST